MRKIKSMVLLGVCFFLLCGFSINKNTTVIVGDSIMAINGENNKGLSGIILDNMTSYLATAQKRANFSILALHR